MCGIAAIISPTAIEKQVIKSMTDIISHRGPDGEGHKSFFEGRIWFGHRRLSIIDLSEAGHQPMSYMNGRYWITYNGEVYNYLEIRQELEQEGYQFQSHTDTEVIMAAYHRWGTDCLHKFNGMWAFVILDVATKKLFVARDRFGIKPLYYSIQQGRLFVFSETKQVVSTGIVQTAPNIDYLNMFLERGAVEYLPDIAFTNIYRFPVASYVELSFEQWGSGKQRIEPIRYWNLQPNVSDEEFNANIAGEYASQYRHLLKDAVSIALRADVGVGSALSGGIDSSSIVVLVNELLREAGKTHLQETFSSVYTSSEQYKSSDESHFIATMASYLGVKSHTVEPAVDNVPSEHRKMIYHLDTPPNNTVMSSWHTYKLVREKGITVTLDGQGADEQLAGYLEFLVPYFSTLKRNIISEYRAFGNVPGAQKKIVKTLLARYSGGINSPALRYMQKRGINFPDFGLPLNLALKIQLDDAIQNQFHMDEHAAMAFSIESRVPYLDYRLVELTASIPACYKLHDGWTKYIARLAFQDNLPKAVVWRRDKTGWSIPEEAWFTEHLGDWALSTIQSSTFVQEMTQGNIPRTKEMLLAKLGYSLRLLNLAVWYDVFFENKR